ncbi:MAG: S1 RNA-binding domain-containing protein, partial [Myxococcota bacterium]|nr:S1 RNA-binding domain-containing protein [Myxococcota bacterium]
TSDSLDHGGNVALTETTSEPGADTQPMDQDVTTGPSPARGQHAKDKKKERKYQPRERPPVNAGDIIFGKILEITDEAILVDIPGKAHAIFDRREMLLPDDDDARTPVRAPVSTQKVTAEPSSEEPTPDNGGVLEPSASPEAVEPEGASSDLERSELPAEVQATPPTPSDPPEPPKEPKLPRVVLEVGADFIAVVHNDGARGGLVVLTHHPNRAERVKPVVEKAFQDKTTMLALVTGVIKGGIEVDVDGLRAFAPGSHVDMRMGADLFYLVGKRLPFIVTQYARRGRDVVLSRKSIIEEEAKQARIEALARLKVGEDLDGVVRSVVAFGAFVDVGGIEGLVPLQEMSHNRSDGPSDVFKAGEATRVRVMKVDDRGKVWLSRKATIPDPWQEVALKYAQGTRHTAKVVRLQPFGAFVELEPGIDGLIHTQDLSIKRIESPSDVVKVNDPIDVIVANVDSVQHKIALHPAPHGDFANEPAQRVVPHKPVKVRIVTIESGGLVVRILGVTGRNARGYITSAGTGTPRGTELRKAFKVNQDVDAKVVEVDPRRGEVKLSIKALSEEQERSAYQQYRQQLKAEARFTLADMLTKKGSPR